MNTVQLTGRTTAEIDLRYTKTGKAVARFTLAVNRMKKDDGADFISCQVWGKAAENMKQYVRKGHKVAVIGHIRTDSYEKNGQRIYTTDVIADAIEFLEQKPQSKPAEDYSGSGYSETDDDLPF